MINTMEYRNKVDQIYQLKAQIELIWHEDCKGCEKCYYTLYTKSLETNIIYYSNDSLWKPTN